MEMEYFRAQAYLKVDSKTYLREGLTVMDLDELFREIEFKFSRACLRKGPTCSTNSAAKVGNGAIDTHLEVGHCNKLYILDECGDAR